MTKRGLAVVVVLLCLPVLTARANNKSIGASRCLETKMEVSQEVGNVFSRTVAFQVNGFDPLVFRVSGTGIYKVKSVSAQEIVTDSTFLYDGRPASTGETTIKDGGRTICWKGKCSIATDASGVSINALLWGTPKGKLHVGQSWDVVINVPWELGPAGKETVKVLSIDPANDTITLERRGEGEGESASEVKQLHLVKDKTTYVVDVSTGKAKWDGTTTFRRGVILSDELLVERTVTVTSKELGQSSGVERQYILLNATQPDLLRD
ncbi:MAG TPA: hypothetical protein VKB26_12145 [Candidatus Acidoferrales bacterium]|nr:hypothetical protein [Candidatus Acidoferrales bacterium]